MPLIFRVYWKPLQLWPYSTDTPANIRCSLYVVSSFQDGPDLVITYIFKHPVGVKSALNSTLGSYHLFHVFCEPIASRKECIHSSVGHELPPCFTTVQAYQSSIPPIAPCHRHNSASVCLDAAGAVPTFPHVQMSRSGSGQNHFATLVT